MRVIAGSHGGRRLKAPAGRRTRPTSDRVREALFAMLGPLDGEVVLDLFAGTGALGIEALSRGAARAVFVERDSAAAGVLAENLSSLSIGPRRPNCAGRRARGPAERTRAGRGIRSDLHRSPLRPGAAWGSRLSAVLPALLAPDGRIIVESDRREPLELDAPISTERRYGDTSITIHTRTCPDPQAR